MIDDNSGHVVNLPIKLQKNAHVTSSSYMLHPPLLLAVNGIES